MHQLKSLGKGYIWTGGASMESRDKGYGVYLFLPFLPQCCFTSPSLHMITSLCLSYQSHDMGADHADQVTFESQYRRAGACNIQSSIGPKPTAI